MTAQSKATALLAPCLSIISWGHAARHKHWENKEEGH